MTIFNINYTLEVNETNNRSKKIVDMEQVQTSFIVIVSS